MTTILAATLLHAATFVSVQVGSFSEEPRAISTVEELRRAGYDAYFLRAPSVEEGQSTYKVRVGKFPDKVQARMVAEKLKARGGDYAGAFPAETDLQETVHLSHDIVTLVGALGTVNPGRVKREGTGRRLAEYVQNYLVLYLVAGGFDPGTKLSDLAVWDTNPDNEPEVFAVLDAKRAFALFWERAQSRYALAELASGERIEMAQAFDLTAGPEKFIAVRYERGGDLYEEKGYSVYRWDQPNGTFAAVGTIPLEVMDKGIEGSSALSWKRVLDVTNVDLDRDREIVAHCTVEGGKSHVDVWDWDGKGLLSRVSSVGWFEEVLSATPGSTLAGEGLFGLGVERGLADDLDGALDVFQLLVSKYPSLQVAARAQQAIQQLGRRQRIADVLGQTGFEELKAGAHELAAADLAEAAQQDPGNPRVHYSLAVARVRTGDTLGALRALSRAIELDPDDAMQMREKARVDSELSSLRTLPEFKEILQ